MDHDLDPGHDGDLGPDPDPDSRRAGPTRRTVLRGVGHAAWVAPAVVVVGQAPALAAASGPAVSQVVLATRNGADLLVYDEYFNQSAQATGPVDVTITVTATTGTVAAGPAPFYSFGWVPVGDPTGTSQSRTYTFRRASGIPPAGGQAGVPDENFTVRFALVPVTAGATTVSEGTVTALATTTYGQVSPGSGAWT